MLSTLSISTLNMLIIVVLNFWSNYSNIPPLSEGCFWYLLCFFKTLAFPPGHISRKKKKTNSDPKRYLHLNIHSSTIYNNHDREANLNVHQQIKDKEDVVHRYNRIVLSHKKNKIMPIAATWMQLEVIIVNEVSQKEKDKHHMISLICGI